MLRQLSARMCRGELVSGTLVAPKRPRIVLRTGRFQSEMSCGWIALNSVRPRGSGDAVLRPRCRRLLGPRLRKCEAMTLRCRPRAGGDPYAAAKAMWRQPKTWWLWVPAGAGTTAV